LLSRVPLLGGGVLLVLGVSGCPVTDDYYIDAGHGVASGSGGDVAEAGGTLSGSVTAAATQGGSAQGSSTSSAGGPAGATGGIADTLLAGAPAAGQAGDGAAGMASAPCVPTTERCNGHDDDCDDFIDELACNTNTNGTTGCAGFTVAVDPNHGYMLCTGVAKDFTHAKDACAGQEMRLAWLESAAENTAVAAAVKKLTSGIDILFGATDQAREGDWLWDGAGGFQFWKGAETGAPVGGHFNNWAEGPPNNDNGGEDCVVFNSTTAYWGDRTCVANYAYVCEDVSP
jgi:hypothetical protein